MATEKVIKKLYNDTVEIVFYPNSHQYRRDNRILVSSTGATGMLDKSQVLIRWALGLTKDYLLDVRDTGKVIGEEDILRAIQQHEIRKDKAADIGTQIHAWAEAYARGENPEMPEDENIVNGVLGFLKWVDENQVKFLETERFIYSKEHDFVGTMDIVFTMGKEDHKILHPADYKSSSGIYDSMRYQIASYKEAYREETQKEIGSSFILRFAKEDKFNKTTGELIEHAGNFEILEIPEEEHVKDFECFGGLLACKKRDKELQAIWRQNNLK